MALRRDSSVSAGDWSFLLAPRRHPARRSSDARRSSTIATAPPRTEDFPSTVRIMRMVDRIVPPTDSWSRCSPGSVCPPATSSNHRHCGVPFPGPSAPARSSSTTAAWSLCTTSCTLRAFAIIQLKYPEASLTLAHEAATAELEGWCGS